MHSINQTPSNTTSPLPLPSQSMHHALRLYAAVYLRCKVVTNDEMRDHHFQMLHAR